MINHARTLLLNSKETDDPAPWERYMGPYARLALPDYLEKIRLALVGSGGWWDRTYRVEMLLTMLDSPKHAGKFDWMDARVTPPLVEPFVYYEPAITVTRIPLPSADPYVAYLTKNSSSTVPVKRLWTVYGTTTAAFRVVYLGNSFTLNAYNDPAAGGWRLQIADDFDLLFSSVGDASEAWNVRAYTKPQNAFAVYPAIVNSLSTEWVYKLFSVTDNTDDPLKEYVRWRKECVHAEDQIAAVTLAYLLRATRVLTGE